MNTKGKAGTGGARSHFDRGSERHGGSRAGGQNAARLSDRGNRRNQPLPFRSTQRRFRKRWRLSGAASTMSSVAASLRLSRANRRRAYNSPAYEAIKPIRQGASVSRMFMAEGLPPQ